MENPSPHAPGIRLLAWIALVLVIASVAAAKIVVRRQQADAPQQSDWLQFAGADITGDLLVYGGEMGRAASTAQVRTELERLALASPDLARGAALRSAALDAHEGNNAEAAQTLREATTTESDPFLTIADGLDTESDAALRTAGLDASSSLTPLWVRRALRLANPACNEAIERNTVAAEAPTRVGRILALMALFLFGGCLSVPAFLGALLAVPISRFVRAARPAPAPALPTAEPEPEAHEPPAAERPSWGPLDAFAAIALFFAMQLLVSLVLSIVVTDRSVQFEVLASAFAFLASGGIAVWFLRWRGGPGFWALAGFRPYPTWKAAPLALWGVLALPVPMLVVGLVYMRLIGGPPMSQNPAIDMMIGADTWWAKLVMFLLVAVGAPLVEETLMRGSLFVPIRDRLGPTLAVAITAAVFALAHFDFIALPQYLLIGTSLGIVRQVSGSLKAPMILHGLWNGTTFILLSLVTA